MTTQKVSVLITGANQGIGFGLASLLARSTSPTYHVLLCSRDLSKGKAAAASLSNLPGTVEALELDVTSAASVATAGKYVAQVFPCLDVLINNAAIAIYDEVTKDRVVLPEALRQSYETNVIGAAAVTEAMLPSLRKSRDPRVVFVTSLLGSLTCAADPGSAYYDAVLPAYNSSKTALNMIMLCYHKQLSGKDGAKAVKVWALCPGYRGTNLNPRGTGTAEGGGQVILDVIQGKRDEETGKIVHEDGVYAW